MSKSKAQREQIEKNLVPNRFKSGDEWNGNRNGRPKGTSLTDRLRRLLEENEGKNAEEVVQAVIEEAKKGDPRFAQMIFDRMDGKVTDKLEVEGELNIIEQRFVIAERPKNDDDDNADS